MSQSTIGIPVLLFARVLFYFIIMKSKTCYSPSYFFLFYLLFLLLCSIWTFVAFHTSGRSNALVSSPSPNSADPLQSDVFWLIFKLVTNFYLHLLCLATGRRHPPPWGRGMVPSGTGRSEDPEGKFELIEGDSCCSGLLHLVKKNK